MVTKSSYQNLNNWTLIGTNFTKADIHTRSSFAIANPAMGDLYTRALNLGLKDFFALSTCNRTEFYGSAPLSIMKELVCDQLHLSAKQLDEYFYFETGRSAILHFFRVVSGLNSQIIGDYEIVGQVKKAIQVSRQFGLTGTLTDRVSSLAFHASKEVKAKTNLSHGKYSVSYATAELITAHQSQKQINSILIVGTGEMGHAVSRNLKEYFPQRKLAVTNRTLASAQKLAEEINGEVIPFESFTNYLSQFDAIIATAQADEFLIGLKDIPAGPRLFLDLSVPQAIDPRIKDLPEVHHYSLDEISLFHNELIKQRLLEIPKAEKIIETYIAKLIEWQNVFTHRNVLLSYKEKIGQLIHQGANPMAIEKSFSGLIQRIKSEGYRGCSVIQTVNELIAIEK